MAVLLKSRMFKKLFTAYCSKIEKCQINFRYLSENELSSLPAGIFDNLLSLRTL